MFAAKKISAHFGTAFLLLNIALSLMIGPTTACLADDSPALNPVSASKDYSRVTAAADLKDISDTVKHLNHSLYSLIEETHRRKEVDVVHPYEGQTSYWDPNYSYNENLAGPSAFTYQADLGPLPPRPKFLDLFMGQIDQLMIMLNAQLTEINMSPKDKSEVRVQLQIAQDALNRAKEQESALKALVSASTPDPEAIFKTARKLQDQIKGIADLGKEIAKATR